jgi:hypothetical protein
MTARKTPAKAWQPGQSGNPAGRPKGSGEIGKLRAAIGKALPEIVERLTAQALAGDVGAARLLIERTLPSLRPVELPTPVELPPDASLSEQGRYLLRAVADGKLPASTGATLLGALSAAARVVEVDELAKRVAALEAARDGGAA